MPPTRTSAAQPRASDSRAGHYRRTGLAAIAASATLPSYNEPPDLGDDARGVAGAASAARPLEDLDERQLRSFR